MTAVRLYILKGLLFAGAIIFLQASVVQSQNLVLNGDFEILSPRFGFNQSWFDEVDMLIGWCSPNRSTPNFFHPNSIRKDFCCFGQSAFSGQGFVGIGTSPISRTEYIQGELTAPLVANTEYRIKLHLRNDVRTNLVSDCFGVHISAKRVKTRKKYSSIALTPSVEVDSGAYIVSKEWVEVSWNFVAQGGERYITIGCFNKQRSITKIPNKSKLIFNDPYVHLDNISLTRSTGEPLFDVQTTTPSPDTPALSLWPDTMEITRSFTAHPTDSTAFILDNISFLLGSADLTAESDPHLDSLVAFLIAFPHKSVEVFGHTDSTGNDKDNLTLSEKRAKAIVDYLVSMGVAEKRLRHEGRGSRHPIATNGTEEGRALNRRVEIRFFEE